LRAFGGTDPESGVLDLLVLERSESAEGVDGVDPRDDGECVFKKGAASVSEVPISDAVRTVEKEISGVFSGCGFSLERASAVDAKCVDKGAAGVSFAGRVDGEGTVEKETSEVSSGCSEKGSPL